MRELVNTLGTSASATRDVTGEELHSKLKTLHEQMASDVQNTEHVVDVILRRIRKMTSDDPAALSSDSDSPGSSCASISKSESSTGYSQ